MWNVTIQFAFLSAAFAAGVLCAIFLPKLWSWVVEEKVKGEALAKKVVTDVRSDFGGKK